MNKDGYKGLTDEQVEESRLKHGRNVLSPPVRTPLWKMFLEKFSDPLITILMVIGVFAFAVSAYEYWVLSEDAQVFFEPVGIFVAILLATGLSFFFELKAQKEFTILNAENDNEPVTVRRNGSVREIPRADVVVGDVLILQTGQEVAADASLVKASHLLVDESSLTGEPAHAKGLGAIDGTESSTYPSDRVYRGTQVIEGHGVAVVNAVGDNTENGRIMQSLRDVDGEKGKEGVPLTAKQRIAMRLRAKGRVTQRVKTPLNEQLDRLSRVITRMSYAVAVVIVVGRMLTYYNVGWLDGDVSTNDVTHLLAYLLQTIMIAVTLVVVAVPEGLPMAVSLALANSMRKMLKTNNLVRRMHACETMGAATVICTDKTGTLTENQMTVKSTTFGNLSDELKPVLYEGMALNSTATLDSSSGVTKVVGNPTEGALLLWLRRMGIDYDHLRNEVEVIDEIPFSTERKFMAVLVKSAAKENHTLLYIKGAPERIISMSALSGERKAEVDNFLSECQQKAMRTLAFAYMEIEDGKIPEIRKDNVLSGAKFLGVVGIEDPVREEVKEAVRQCLDAGIDIKIVTGDTSGTAREIGRQISVWRETYDERNIIDGEQFAALSHEELLQRVDDFKIVSRARPMDKKRLVEALQERGHVVAVTGDGTNDAPALHAAHVGLSMGSGTSVAKEASDITIIDDSFASIVRAVKWGRSLFLNIQRFLLFQLTVNVAACLLVLYGAFMGTQSPLTVTQMLWVNLIMDTFGAFALSALPPSDSVMHCRPRNRFAFILDSDMRKEIIGVGMFFFLLLGGLLYVFQHIEISSMIDILSAQWGDKHELTPYELTLLFTIFVMTHFWYMFNARAYNTGGSGLNLRDCDGFLIIAVIIIVGQIAMVQVPLLNNFFNVVPLSFLDWVIIIVLSSLVLWIREAYSMIKNYILKE